jgi:hypothetical protein
MATASKPAAVVPHSSQSANIDPTLVPADIHVAATLASDALNILMGHERCFGLPTGDESFSECEDMFASRFREFDKRYLHALRMQNAMSQAEQDQLAEANNSLPVRYAGETSFSYAGATLSLIGKWRFYAWVASNAREDSAGNILPMDWAERDNEPIIADTRTIVRAWQKVMDIMKPASPIDFKDLEVCLAAEQRRMMAIGKRGDELRGIATLRTATGDAPPPPPPAVPLYIDGKRIRLLDGTILTLSNTQAKCLEVLIDHGPMRKSRLDELAGMPPYIVSNPLKSLVNLVEKFELQDCIETNPGHSGRGYSTTIKREVKG